MYSSKIQDKPQAAEYSAPRLMPLGSIQAFVLGAYPGDGDANGDSDETQSGP